ncbi:MAG: preprotein translocase subunit SecG, partial [Nitrospira sp.]|nr:preprotein translocase subunit SecG [Nitrospira sp.]MCA9474803.1 preprotein translocase subunit SecG [Nitrospira sp.]MCA9479676.1 preprotein translocase subunit SecG [Nitrospira sp.]
MYTLTIIIHLIVCFLMIAAILLQAGKGAEIGASFGGSSQTVFGSRGPGTFLSKVTVGAAVIFMLTSLSLAFLSKQANTSSTVIDLHSP